MLHCVKKFQTKFKRLKCSLNWTKFLYSINVTLIITLIYIVASQKTGNGDKNRATTIDRYNELIERSMQIFDYMQQLKIGQIITKPNREFDEVKSIDNVWCWTKPVKPGYADIDWEADNLWQKVDNNDDIRDEEIYIYSAYYDTRFDETMPEAECCIRILAMVQENLNRDIYCQIWWPNEDNKPYIVRAIAKHIWEKAWDPRSRFYVPYLFTCPIRRKCDQNAPGQVSLVTSACRKANNLLRVNHHRPMDGIKRHTVVCVKGMDFLDDLSLRFVEWLEANYVVGADKIVIYTYAVHPEVGRIIEYYENNRNDSFLNIPLTLPGRMPNAPLHRSRFIKRNRQQKRRNEIIPYNDCLYRHLYTHHYVLIIDVDELVVPLMQNNWKEMIDFVKDEKRGDRTTYSAFSIANAFFFDNLTTSFDDEQYPSYLHMLRHDVRSKDISPAGVYGKSFMQIDSIATVFNHFPLHKLRRNLRPTVYVNGRVALKNHYKEVCPVESRDECPTLYANTLQDHSIRKFAKDIKRNVERVLTNLNKIQR